MIQLVECLISDCVSCLAFWPVIGLAKQVLGLFERTERLQTREESATGRVADRFRERVGFAEKMLRIGAQDKLPAASGHFEPSGLTRLVTGQHKETIASGRVPLCMRQPGKSSVGQHREFVISHEWFSLSETAAPPAIGGAKPKLTLFEWHVARIVAT